MESDLEGDVYRTVTTPRFGLRFTMGADDDAATVENIDAVIIVGSKRWSVTFLTLREIRRLMDRWSSTGEAAGGHFFQCRDLVIVREPGIGSMTRAVEGLFDEGGPEGVLPELD